MSFKSDTTVPLETHKGFIGHGWCHLTHHGSGERFTFGSFLYKKGDILLEWVSGKLQCEAFIGPKRVPKIPEGSCILLSAHALR